MIQWRAGKLIGRLIEPLGEVQIRWLARLLRVLIWGSRGFCQTLTAATTLSLNLSPAGDASRGRSPLRQPTSDRAPELGQQAQYRQSQQGAVGS
ncbi:MAG: hypothetical protein SNJ81_09315 [Cyanobacteriota bacterium]